MDRSEDELIGAIRKILSGTAPGVIVGAGDDAAVVEPGSGEQLLTADMLVEGVHFELALTSARDLGWKAIIVNLSDIAAMGGSPRYALVSVALSPAVDTAWAMELFGGMRGACDEFGLSLVGGDLSRGRDVTIGVTVVGEVAPGHAVLRSGARPGDRIVVTGELGAAAGGLRLGRAGRADVVGSEWARRLLEAQFRPVARVGEGLAISRAGATAMMDLSDGLSLDLSRLCRESGVGARIDLGRLPIAEALEMAASVLGVDPLELALSGGEDYELLATLPPDAVEAARLHVKDAFGVTLTDVGVIIEEGLIAVHPDGRESVLEPAGWDHFEGS